MTTRQPKEITLSVRGINLAALHWQANSKVRILALHGWLDNAESFTALANHLDDVEIVALDFPGHGHSQHRPEGEILHYVDYIADIYAVLSELKWDNCILMGHSMGGGVASVFASAFPNKLKGLICLDGLGPITSDVDHLPERLNKSVRLNLKQITKAKTIYPDVDAAIDARHQAGDLSRDSVKTLVRRNLKKIDSGYVWRSDSRLRLPSMFYLSEPQALAYMDKIITPTLMIRPDDSSFRAQDALKNRASRIKDINWQSVIGGHHAHMDHPEEIAPLINSFIHSINKD